MGAGAHASAGAHVGASLHVVVPRSTCNVQPSTSTLLPHPLAPLASRLSPHPPSPRPSPQTLQVGRSPPTRAHTPVRAHMSVHPCTLSSHVQRATFNLQPARLAPRASRLIPSHLAPSPQPLAPRPSPQTLEVRRSPPARAYTPVRTHMSVHPSTLSSHLQRATFNLQLLAPRATAMAPAASPGAAALRPSTLSSHLQRATFNLQLLAPHPLVPLASRLTPLAPTLPITPPSVNSYTHRFACQRTVICVVYYRARFVPASFPGLWQSTLSACTRRTGVHLLQFDWSTVWT